MANDPFDTFVKAVSIEISNDIRVNTVAPSIDRETMEMMGIDQALGLSATDTAKSYNAAVEGDENRITLDVPETSTWTSHHKIFIAL